MPDSVYELLSLAARYWFIFLGAVIVLRSFLWLRRDRAEKHRRLRSAPDAGFIGELAVVSGNDELQEGMLISVPREGSMGYLRTNDIVVPVAGVAAKHCDFLFREPEGLFLRPRRGCTLTVDGTEISNEAETKLHPMQHGSVLRIGEAELKLRVFMGIEIGHAAERRPDEDAQDEDAVPGLADLFTQPEAPYQIGVPAPEMSEPAVPAQTQAVPVPDEADIQPMQEPPVQPAIMDPYAAYRRPEDRCSADTDTSENAPAVNAKEHADGAGDGGGLADVLARGVERRRRRRRETDGQN